MRKALCVLFAAAFALSSLTGTASAEPHDLSAQALSCAAGNLCVWPVRDGSRNRCSYTTDWPGSGSFRCWWQSTNPVWAVYNNTPTRTMPGCACIPARTTALA
jgi:hypothetical protein